MNNKLTSSIALLLTAALAAAPMQDTSSQEVRTVEETSTTQLPDSHIRMDLLLGLHQEAGTDRRNVFRPGSSRPTAVLPQDRPDPEALRGLQPGQRDPGAPIPAQSFFPSLQYVGYVHSEDRIVALVVFQGETLAVEEKDILDSRLSVGAITADEIELVGPDSQTRKYSFEGEIP